MNYYRYKNNYEKYVGEEKKDGTEKPIEQGTIKTIASPRLMSKLSPVAQFVKNQGINVNPMSQKGLLKYALNKDKVDEKKFVGDDGSDSDEQDFSKFGSKKAAQNEKERREKELEELKKQGLDKIDESGAIRLPNRVSKGVSIDPNTGTAKSTNERDVIMSPTSFLRGAASPRINNFGAGTEEDCIQFEGEMIRKATETKLKKYWYCLLGKELYVYKNKQEEKHKGMHNLVGVFIKDEPEE